MMRRGNKDDVRSACLPEQKRATPMLRVEVRLQQWAREYVDSPARGWTILAKLIDHAGFVPDARGYAPVPINTLADDVEKIVQEMGRNGMRREAMVLRCEYFDVHSPDVARLDHLRALGHSMSRAGYYTALSVAKAYVAGKLGC